MKWARDELLVLVAVLQAVMRLPRTCNLSMVATCTEPIGYLIELLNFMKPSESNWKAMSHKRLRTFRVLFSSGGESLGSVSKAAAHSRGGGGVTEVAGTAALPLLSQ